MTSNRAYRCLECLEHTLTRNFDTSHLSATCPVCDSFERYVNEVVYEQFETFEASPPSSLDWDRLSRMEKLMVSERIARSTRTVDDFSITELGES